MTRKLPPDQACHHDDYHYSTNRTQRRSRSSHCKSVKPYARNAANARERTRMRILSKAFQKLKNALPWVPPDTKLSKLDTLRLATLYIQHLCRLLSASESEVIDLDASTSSPCYPSSLSWPFSLLHHHHVPSNH